MFLFVDPLKLKAAARSMPQFRPVVRTLFPGPVHDVVVEAATIYLYLTVCRQVFSRRFTTELSRFLVRNVRCGRPGEVAARVKRLAKEANSVEHSLGRFATSKDQEFRDRIRGMILSLFAEGGYPDNDPELVRTAFEPFEQVVRRIKVHLSGIKEQNHFVLK
jgi:hypothetical protein